MGVPASLLSKLVKELPDDFVMKSKSVVNYLQKRGVKPEELDYSGFNKSLSDMDPELKVTKQHLTGLDSSRPDVFHRGDAVEEDSVYIGTTLPDTKIDTYRENLQLYSNKEEQGLRKVQSHWNDYGFDDVLWHSRTSEDVIEGKKTRIVQEIQSDLHQQGRKKGYSPHLTTDDYDKLKQESKQLVEEREKLLDKDYINSLLSKDDLTEFYNISKRVQEVNYRLQDIENTIYGSSDTVPDAPFKKNWHEKALEQEILDAATTGREAIAVPLEGMGTNFLSRGAGVKKWYDTTVRNTMKKLAKRIGGEYKETTNAAKAKVDLKTEDFRKIRELQGQLVYNSTNNGKIMGEIEAVFKNAGFSPYDDAGVLEADLHMDPSQVVDVMLERARSTTSDKVIYGQIVLPKDKKGLEKLYLYSAGGAEALLIAQSLDKGAQPDELKDFLTSEKGWEEDKATAEVDRVMKQRLQASLAKGAPKDELLDYVAEQKGYDRSYLESLLGSKKEENTKEQPESSGSLVDKASEQFSGMMKKMFNAMFPEEVLMGAARKAGEMTADGEDVGILGTTELMGDMLSGRNTYDASSPQERRAKVENIYNKYSTLYNDVKGLADNEARLQAMQDHQDVTKFVVNNLNENGIEAQYDDELNEILIKDENGNPEVLTTSVWDDIVASKGEIIAGMSAGMAASGLISSATTGLRAGATPMQKAGIAGASFAATAGAGALGAMFGRHQDITRNAIETKETIDNQLIWSQLKDAGAADVVFSVVGTAVVKSGIGISKGMYRAYDMVLNGNKEGAYKALKEFMNLDDMQIDEIVRGWENLTGERAPGMTRASKAIAVVPRTAPGGEAIAAPAAHFSPATSANLVNEIDARAQDLLKKAETISSDNISTILRDEMTLYKDKVKQVFQGAKEYAAQEMADKPYRFDYSKLAIDPLIERTVNELTNSTMRDRALLFLQNVRRIGGVEIDKPVLKQVTTTSQMTRKFARSGPQVITKEVPTVTKGTEKVIQPTLRKFDDLLDLRRVLNEFGNSRLVKNQKDIALLTKIRSNIDDEIARAANKHMENPKEWLNLWQSARTEYSKMFDLEANVLYRQIMRKGTTDKLVARQLMNRAMSTDNTFREVIEKLPPKIRALTENAVMQEFVSKFTAGEEGGLRAIQFPMLAKELNQVGFTTPAAQDLKRVVNEFAGVFKNDVMLSRATGSIRMPAFQSYLTTDPVVRLQYEVASIAFNSIRSHLPGKKAQSIALVRQAAKVLEHPKNARAIEDLIKALPNDPTLRNTLRAKALELAKFGERTDYPRVPIFRRAAIGQSLSPSKGPLGEGIYYSVTKGKSGGQGKLSSRLVLPTRIANKDNVLEVLSMDKLPAGYLRDHPEVQELLKDKGFLGISIGDKVLIFK